MKKRYIIIHKNNNYYNRQKIVCRTNNLSYAIKKYNFWKDILPIQYTTILYDNINFQELKKHTYKLTDI